MKKGFTFGYKKPLAAIPITPGPADYCFSSQDSLDRSEHTNLSINFSKTPRFQKAQDHLSQPGPGSYDPHEINSKIPLPIIGKSGRDPRCFLNSKDIPGPGNYNIPSLIGKQKRRPPLSNRSQTDGLSQFSAEKQGINTPGPGHYSINDSYLRSSHSIKISSQGTGKFKVPSFLYDNGYPGPGKYSMKNIKNGPKFTFGQRTEAQNKPAIQPGPDSYNVNLMNTSGLGNKFFRNANFSFSKATKHRSEVNNEKRYFPGPGNYNLRKESPLLTENGVVFNRAIRPLYKSGSLTPGPGTYIGLPSLIKQNQKGYSISSNIKNKKWHPRFKRQESYDSIEEEEKKQAENKRLEFLNKFQLKLNKNHTSFGTPRYVPSPRVFDSVKQLRRTNSEAADQKSGSSKEMISFVKRNSSLAKMPVKSPFNKLDNLKGAKSFSMGKSMRKLEYLDPGNVSPNIVRSPGPAGYEINRILDKKAVKIAVSKRDDRYLVLNVNPGAGSYNVNSSSFHKGNQKKKKMNKNLVELLKRIELKVHPEKNKDLQVTDSYSTLPKPKIKSRRNQRKDFAVVVVK